MTDEKMMRVNLTRKGVRLAMGEESGQHAAAMAEIFAAQEVMANFHLVPLAAANAFDAGVTFEAPPSSADLARWWPDAPDEVVAEETMRIERLLGEGARWESFGGRLLLASGPKDGGMWSITGINHVWRLVTDLWEEAGKPPGRLRRPGAVMVRAWLEWRGLPRPPL